MGIKGLTQLIKKTSPDSIQHTGLYAMKDQRVAIDTSIFLYKSLINCRYNGDYLRSHDGKIVSHIQGLYYKTNQYLSMGITPIYIFDGKPPIEKSECIRERVKKAQDCKAKSDLETDEKSKQNLEKGSIRIKKEYIDDLKHLFDMMGVSYIHADGEAEAYASELCRLGVVDAVVTEDMDTLAYGCPIMIRGCIDKSIKRSNATTITTFDFQKMLSDFQLTHDQFIDMCILCGCDYCPTITGIGPVRALKCIRKHGTIENYLSNEGSATDEFKAKYGKARELFKVFDGKIDPDNLPIHSSEYDSERIYKHLVNECSMNGNRVTKSLR